MVRRAGEEFLATPKTTTHHLSNHMYFPKFLHDEVVKQSWSGPTVVAREAVLRRRARAALHHGVITADRAREILDLSVWDPLPGQHA